MKTKLMKKMEKDAVMLYPIHINTNRDGKIVDLNENQRLAFIDGIEYGYLEALKQSKEWLLSKIRKEIDADGTIRETDGKFFFHQLADDLSDEMAKLLGDRR